MNLSFTFFFNSILLGIGLAMDAFSVSLANGLNEPCMKHTKMCTIAGMFAFFQGLMPMIGWVFVHTIIEHFKTFKIVIPWVSLILLCFIGGKMLYEGINCKYTECEKTGVGFLVLIMQGVATSIDALSVGFTIANYDTLSALLASFIISAVTFLICMGGILIGKKMGTVLSGKANIFGGLILIFIGLEIFISGII